MKEKWNNTVMDAMEQRLNAGARQAAEAVADEARKQCPVDSGRLRESIDTARAGNGHYVVSADAPYAAVVEFGTSRTEPRPFLRSALKLSARQALNIIRETK